MLGLIFVGMRITLTLCKLNLPRGGVACYCLFFSSSFRSPDSRTPAMSVHEIQCGSLVTFVWHESESTMLMLGSIPYVPKEPCLPQCVVTKEADVMLGMVWSNFRRYGMVWYGRCL